MKKIGLLLIVFTGAAMLSLSLIILYNSPPVQQQNATNNVNATPTPTSTPQENKIQPTNTPNPSIPTIDGLHVKISQFSSQEGWFCPGGVAMGIVFDVAIQNFGTQNITNLKLLVKTTEGSGLSSVQTLTIASGETVYLYADVATNIDRYTRLFYNSTFTAIIDLNGVVLDEKTIEITQRQF